MITSGATSLRVLIWENAVPVVIVVGLVVGTEVWEHYLDTINFERSIFSMAALGVITTALSIFLAFRVNEAYARWWEARILWGGFVNFSRTFARQVTTLVNSDDERQDQWRRELVYRHLAYINAVRMTLRCENDWQSLEEYIPAEELDKLLGNANKATQLLQTQGQRVAALRKLGAIDQFGHLMLDRSLSELFNLQGACERIKTTAFPDRVAYFTRLIAWCMAVMVPICVLEADEKLDLLDFFVVPSMMLMFVVTERLGADLKNPFEGRPNDTPMSTLCRTIEIDLRQQLGETEVPEPLQPHRGVLM
jgi:putative membrane protein